MRIFAIKMHKHAIYILLLYMIGTNPAFCQTERKAEIMSWEDFAELIIDENNDEGSIDEATMEQM